VKSRSSCRHRAQVSKIVDDEKNGLIGAVRHNRRNKAPGHKNSQRLPGEFKHETGTTEPQSITATFKMSKMSFGVENEKANHRLDCCRGVHRIGLGG
jgi:hypothetical protein